VQRRLRIVLFAWLALLLPALPALAQSRGPLLVLPFDNVAREPRIYWLAEGAAVLLADKLIDLGANALARPEREHAFERLNLPPLASLSQATMIKVGQIVGASEIVTGRLELQGDRLTVTARGVTLEPGRARPDVIESGRLDDLFAIFDRVARGLVPALPPAPDAAAAASPPLGAFEHYIKGLIAESSASRLKYLDTALRMYPAYNRVRLAIWEAYTDQGEHSRALDAVQRVPGTSRFSRRARFLAGLSRIELRQYDQAFTELKELLDQPTSALYNNLGVVQLRRASNTQAGRPTYFFTQAADRDPADPDYCFNLGYAYWLERDVQAAIYWLREAVRRDPADSDAHFVLGTALHSIEPGVEATREKELARQLSARYEDELARSQASDQVPRGLERVKRDLDTPRVAQVEAAFVNAVQREQREVATYHLEAGRRLFAEQKDDQAVVELRRALFLSPYLPDAHLLLGRIYLRTGRVADAIDALKVSIWSEETLRGRLALAEAYLQANNLAGARAEVQRAQVLDPASTDVRRLLDDIARRETKR
jgi:tetratricopeptide (TPR) repeat protein